MPGLRAKPKPVKSAPQVERIVEEEQHAKKRSAKQSDGLKRAAAELEAEAATLAAERDAAYQQVEDLQVWLTAYYYAVFCSCMTSNRRFCRSN